jgi:hypothetical protein
MRLSSTWFTHASTAVFGLAVAGYAALRLSGYEVPHEPGPLLAGAPSVIERAPDTIRATSRSTLALAGTRHHAARHTEPDVGSHTSVVGPTRHRVERPAPDSTTDGETDQGTDPADVEDPTASDPTPDATSDDTSGDEPSDDEPRDD